MYSVQFIGSHQKINRAAHRHLRAMNAHSLEFPSIHQLLKFEGKNGPDGIKRKSPSQDEPWHYYDPFDEEDSGLLEIIEEHYANLVRELRLGNNVRVAFEASWLAHALVDGLTPAHHHHHYEEGLSQIYGQGVDRNSKLKKVVVPLGAKEGFVKGNWKMWGAKGLLSTHMLFEGGAAIMMLVMRHNAGRPSGYDLKTAEKIGLVEYFKRTAREVAIHDMYERFYDHGWTSKLAREIHDELAPKMVKTVTVAWHLALIDAGLVQPVLACENNPSI